MYAVNSAGKMIGHFPAVTDHCSSIDQWPKYCATNSVWLKYADGSLRGKLTVLHIKSFPSCILHLYEAVC